MPQSTDSPLTVDDAIATLTRGRAIDFELETEPVAASAVPDEVLDHEAECLLLVVDLVLGRVPDATPRDRLMAAKFYLSSFAEGWGRTRDAVLDEARDASNN